MLVAAIKAVSLAYLLGLITLSLAVLYWRATEGLVTPRHRASVSFWLVVAVSLLTLGCTGYILWGVVSFRIQMITDYFHTLMHGGWAAAIVAGGFAVLLLSLILAFIGWRRSRVPPAGELLSRAEGLAVKSSESADTASLVGVFHPEIWVNPDYWAGLDEERRAAVIAHERVHLRRRDNLKKLVVQFVATLYYAVPWLRTLPGKFEYYTELAVDDACQRELGKPRYLALIGEAASFILRRHQRAVASNLSASEMVMRLNALEAEPVRRSRAFFASLAVLGTVISVLPALALTLHPLSRCLLACYLGY
ncbi:MAG TPA: hypothetical protein ENO21_04085 [Firmicutes bacterium]|nr:hypothetical protein [Bacillota bacterium]